MELSNRLQAVANLVTKGYSIADIGTDHAYIPIYLVEKQLTPRAIAMDINKGPLEGAKSHVKECDLESSIQMRLSNGFEHLKAGEVDSAIIAGMGGGLMMNILESHWDVTCSLKECILQPQSEIAKVRAFLLREGFLIVQENMVLDDGKFYSMMKVIPPSLEERKKEKSRAISDENMWSEVELRYGKYLLEDQNQVLKRFLERELLIRNQILKGLESQSGDHISARRCELEEDLKYIQEGLEYYAM